MILSQKCFNLGKNGLARTAYTIKDVILYELTITIVKIQKRGKDVVKSFH